MPGVLAPVSYEPIKAVRVQGSQGNTVPIERHKEAATQTFNIGAPVMLDGSGNIVEFSSAGANIIYGVSSEYTHNLATAGVGVDYSAGAPVNQPSGLTIPVGAWPADGRIGVYLALGEVVFTAALKAGQTYTDALLIAGTYYGLVKDGTTKFWYIDNTVTTGNGAVVQLVGLDGRSPNTAADGSRVFFTFAQSKRFFT